MKVILPKIRIDVSPSFLEPRLFFLAGPILGGDDWQYRMAQLLKERVDNFFLATPSARWGEGHPLQAYHAEGNGDLRNVFKTSFYGSSIISRLRRQGMAVSFSGFHVRARHRLETTDSLTREIPMASWVSGEADLCITQIFMW